MRYVPNVERRPLDRRKVSPTAPARIKPRMARCRLDVQSDCGCIALEHTNDVVRFKFVFGVESYVVNPLESKPLTVSTERWSLARKTWRQVLGVGVVYGHRHDMYDTLA